MGDTMVSGLKYRLFYGFPGRRLIGYDNEAGKGDHRHVGEREEKYRFTTPEQLVADFLADVWRVRERHVSFPDLQSLLNALTPRRLELLRASGATTSGCTRTWSA